jgi:hypothetical protein
VKLAAYLEDYAFFVHGLLRLHAATNDEKRLRQARELTDRMIADFGDPKEGGFFYTAQDHESLLARPKDPYDNALPSANAVAILNLLALSRLTGESRYLDQARDALNAFSSAMLQNPVALPTMLIGLEQYLDARPASPGLKPLVEGGLVGSQNDIVSLSANWGPGQKIKTGTELNLQVILKIKPGWHIYANPTGSELLRPTTLALKSGEESGKLLRVNYPPGQAKVLGSVSKEKVLLYEEEVEITARVRPTGNALILQVDFQACNDRVCLAPATLEIAISVNPDAGAK